jgi:uncharacterized membrane protein YkvA (DUF1232 family)
MPWLRVAIVLIVCVAASWGVLIVATRRLPGGLLKELAEFLPACVTLVRRLRRDPRIPTKTKWILVLAGLWVVSPIDLIPEFLPVIGPLDDILIVALALRYAARTVPREVLEEAWPAEPRSFERLVGRVARPRAAQ